MANIIEAAKDYLGSVAERTVGSNAYKRWQKSEPTDPNRIDNGIIMGLWQIALPQFAEIPFILEAPQMETEQKSHKMIKRGLLLLTDYPSWIFAFTAHNPIEFAIYKLAANTATHVALDLGGVAINRIRNFRPPSITLAA